MDITKLTEVEIDKLNNLNNYLQIYFLLKDKIYKAKNDLKQLLLYNIEYMDKYIKSNSKNQYIKEINEVINNVYPIISNSQNDPEILKYCKILDKYLNIIKCYYDKIYFNKMYNSNKMVYIILELNELNVLINYELSISNTDYLISISNKIYFLLNYKFK